MQLGYWFTVGEFLQSSSYPELIEDYEISELELSKMFYLVQFVLDPIRFEFGKIKISSGLRPPRLNALVGGKKDSQHLFGEAADCLVDANPPDVYTFIKDGLRFPGEVIWYKPETRFHIALPRIGVKSDYIIMPQKKTTMEV